MGICAWRACLFCALLLPLEASGYQEQHQVSRIYLHTAVITPAASKGCALTLQGLMLRPECLLVCF